MVQPVTAFSRLSDQRARIPLILLLLILLLGTSLRFFAIGSKTVWLDEAFSIWIASHPLPELWQWLVKIDQHPPLYYTLLSLWQNVFGDLQGAVRALSAVFGSATLPLFYLGSKRLTDRLTSLIATFILAISPFHIRFAQEARMYALLTFTVAAALALLSFILIPDAKQRMGAVAPSWAWMGYAVAQAAVMFTHHTALVYFTCAVNFVVGSLWFMQKRGAASSSFPALGDKDFGKRWLFFQGVAFFIWLPWAAPFVTQSIGVDRQFWLSAPTWETIRNTLKTFNFMYLPDWIPLQNELRYLYLLLAALGVVASRGSWARAHLLVSLFLLPIGLALLVSLRRPIYYDRTLIWVSLPYYVLMAAGLRWMGIRAGQYARRALATGPLSISRRKVPLSGPISAAIPLLILLLITFLNFHALRGYYFYFVKEGWDEAATYVAQHAEEGDLLLFNATWVQIPFEYYYRHFDLETELKGMPADLFERGELEPRMMASDVPYLTALVSNRERVWLIYSHEWYTDPNQVVPDALEQIMVKQDEQAFPGLRIMRFGTP